ncbi:MAG: tryptophan synthase subunit alpha [Bacteroidetes bacterium]|nr:MAG: tryptophan synthase subunit alpha [Bacteroidota bacterium]
MNRIQKLFQHKPSRILSVFFTAGFPRLNDTRRVILELAQAGADMIEIGMPYSDPIADGPTIQHSNQIALANGMSLNLLFEQIRDIRRETDIPLLLMGYVNPVLQYGMERFIEKAAEVGIDGLILPDLPMAEYQLLYCPLMDAKGMSNIFLVTPQTSQARIRQIDEASQGFIYVVSSDSTTGRTGSFSDTQKAYFQRIQEMELRNPTLIGFGIHDAETFSAASQYACGAIVGSAFIKALESENADIHTFVHTLIKQ